MVIATIPARYAAPQTARILSITLSSVLNPTLHFRSDSFLFTVFIIRIRAANSTVLYSLHFLYLLILHKVHAIVHELQEGFPAIHPAFPSTAYRAVGHLAEMQVFRQKKHIYSAGFPPFALQVPFLCMHAILHIFQDAPSFSDASESAKTGRKSAKDFLPVLPIIRQKFVKYRHKRSRYTTISYSPMPPDEK